MNVLVPSMNRVVVESVVGSKFSVPLVDAFELVTTALTVTESVDAPATAAPAIRTVAVSDVELQML